MKYCSLIFDLDGTLWDTSLVCARSWNQAISNLSLDIDPVTAADIQSVTGKPFEQCVSGLFPHLANDELAQLTYEIDLVEKKQILKEGGRMYDDVAGSLKLLNEKYSLFMVSNCQAWYLDFFLAWSNLKSLFKDAECFGTSGQSKATNIRNIKDRRRLANPVYIGDTTGDYQAAQNAETAFIHLAHGFGQAEDSWQSFGNFKELAEYLLK